ncbi:MAG: hypothetical protein INQ03_17260 [Candidatus Heimdallarchaeota archaeon]|nr:hypothetical protein [Candidatus Heimdallarchaeota archaeon]
MIFNKKLEILQQSIEKISEIKKSLHVLALMDEKISKEEKVLLDQIDQKMESYKDLVENIVKDKEISNEEYLALKQYEKELLDDLNNKALEDERISEDERDIIDGLKSLLAEIQKAN